MATLKGVGAIFGVGTTATVGVVISANDSRTGCDFNWTADIDELDNSDGSNVVGLAIRKRSKELTITVVPASDATTPTLLEAATEVNTLLVEPGTAVTITCTHAATTITAIAGYYMLTGIRFREVNSGFGLLECDIKQWGGMTAAGSYATVA